MLSVIGNWYDQTRGHNPLTFFITNADLLFISPLGFAYQGPYEKKDKNGCVEIEAQLLSGLVECHWRQGAGPSFEQRYRMDLLDCEQISFLQKVDVSLRFESYGVQSQKVTFKWHSGKPYEKIFNLDMSNIQPVGYWQTL